MPESYMYGLEYASHDFTEEKSFGKNIFTNAFPIALTAYMKQELGLDPNYLFAEIDPSTNKPRVGHSTESVETLLGTSLDEAFWAFEDSFEGYDAFASGTANRSDLVVRNRHSKIETRAFEVKLVTVPTSGTAKKPREQQSCEIVVRPPTVEQMCFSIAASYGSSRRHDLGDMITEEILDPMDYKWSDEAFMVERLPLVVNAANRIVSVGLKDQTPFVLNALWRTEGKSAVFDEECFDIFVWSDMAFLQLFRTAADRSIEQGATSISRPARSMIWLIKSLFDYSVQGRVTFEKTRSEITFGGQTDKAGAFSGNSVMPLIGCENFYHPRVHKDAYMDIVSPEGIDLLSPERRLDGFIKTDYDYAHIHI